MKVVGPMFIAERGNTTIIFNFGETDIREEIEDIGNMELLSSFGQG